MSLSLLLILGISLTNIANVQSCGAKFGQCPSVVNTVETWDSSRYLGDWYAQRQTPSSFQPIDQKCVRAQYATRSDGRVSVYNTGTESNGDFTQICGWAYQVNVYRPGHLKVSFPTGGPIDGDYLIVATDYDNYAVVYSCSPIAFLKLELAWIMTRDPNPNQTIIDMGYNALASQGIQPEFATVAHPSNCNYDNTNSRCIDGPELPRCYDNRNTFLYCYPRIWLCWLPWIGDNCKKTCGRCPSVG